MANLEALRTKAVNRVKKGIKSNEKRAVTVSVRPASFTGRDDEIILGVRVGRHFLCPEHVAALCDALGVSPSDEKLLAIFESAD